MCLRNPFLQIAVVLVLALSVGCSGGGGGPSAAGQNCGGVSAFCLASCNLGCTSIGCSITEIAPNQPIQLDFNQPVDPASVSTASVSLLTPSGQSASGSLLVNRNTITFFPSITSVGGVTQTGFKKGETYTLTLPGGGSASQALRSISGDPLRSSVVCNLRVSLPPIDPNGKPPEGTLLQPTAPSGVSTSTNIVVEFDEIIDIGPFQNATASTSPILYRLRKTTGTGANRVCDPITPAVALPGFPRAVVDLAAQKVRVDLRPTITLPSGVCVEVEITTRVTDLAGNPAIPKTFQFTTAISGSSTRSISETFVDDTQLDSANSSGTWGGNRARPGQIGGDGSLGVFDLRSGRQISPTEFEWNTDNMFFRGTQTVSGQNTTVTDGVFRFSTLKLAQGFTMRFTGSRPPRFIVRGDCKIEGRVLLNAADQTQHQRTNTTGQPGSIAGTGGGDGGKGADKGNGTGPFGGVGPTQFNGQNGKDVRLVAGHAYTRRAVGTGGRGANQFPRDGSWRSITFTGLQNFFSAQIAAGGGGGGMTIPGTTGRALRTTTCKTPPPHNPPCIELGPNAAGGVAFNLFPIPYHSDVVPPGLQFVIKPTHSLDHFLVGGAGGGGGGSHPFWSSNAASNTPWNSGAGGAGGGGAIAFRAGGDLTMSASSTIEVKGGNGVEHGAPPPAPGGGGSGGSVVLQAGDNVVLNGSIDASGGKGGFTNDQFIFAVETRGGDGSPGFIRLETPVAPSPSKLGRTTPAATSQNVGALADIDTIVGCQSLFYPTREVFPPTYLRYELQVVDKFNRTRIYSDDPSWNNGHHHGLATVGAPVRVLVQGAEVDPTTGTVDLTTVGPWHTRVRAVPNMPSLNDDGATGFRFQLLFDRSVEQEVLVKKFTIYIQS